MPKPAKNQPTVQKTISNQASEGGMHKGHGGRATETVKGVMAGHGSKGGKGTERLCAGSSEGGGGVRFTLPGPILDHSDVRGSIGKE